MADKRMSGEERESSPTLAQSVSIASVPTPAPTPSPALSPALLRRLPAYFRLLIRLYGEGKERISSDELASGMGLAPTQVRADMKAIGCNGQRSYGYGITSLYKAVGGALQLCDRFSAVVVGSSPLAEAVSTDHIFLRRGLKLAGTVGDGETEALLRVLTEKAPEIVIFCGDGGYAAKTSEMLGTRPEYLKSVLQVWNFTENEFPCGEIKVKNVRLSDILMELCSGI